MNQVKYMIHASLLILLVFFGYSFVSPVLTSEFEVKYKPEEHVTAPVITKTKFPEGKKLFQQNCQSCHALDKVLTGPALRDFASRGPWILKENIYKWISNPAAFINSDPYAQELQKQYVTIMPGFPGMAKVEIDLIVDFLNEKGE